jgi:hypothetical protein
MNRLRLVCAAAAAALACPALAADYPGRHAAVYWWSGPYYIANQGPEISGPGIVITEIPFTPTGVRRHYPYIRSFRRLPHVVTTTHYYSVPARLDPSVRPRPASRAPWRRKPIRSRF